MTAVDSVESPPSERARLRGRLSPYTRDLQWLALLFLLVLLIQLRFLKPPWIYDPADYFHSAVQWPDVFIHHRPLRVGLVLPVRLAQEVFGLSEAAWYAVPLLSLLLLVLATYVVGRLLFGRVVGVGAGLLVAANPYVLTWSSQIFPDIPSAALFTAAVAIVLAVAQRRRSGVPLDRRDHLWLVGAGLLLGWAYLVREFIVVVFPVVVVILLLHRVRRTAILTVMASAAAVLGLELLLNQLLYGDAFLRIREIIDKPAISSDRAEARVAARREARGSVIDRLVLLPRLLLRNRAGWAFLGLGGLMVAGVALDRRRRGLPLLLWAGTIWAVLIGLSFVEVTGGQAVLHPALMRYWYPLFPPLVVAGLGGTMILAEQVLRRRGAAIVAVVAAVAVALGYGIQDVAHQSGSYARGADHFHELRDYLATARQDARVLWTDGRTGRVLPLYTSTTFGSGVWGGEVRWLNNGRQFIGRGKVSAGELVLLDDDFFRARHSNMRGAVPDWITSPSRTWDMAFMPDNSQFVLLSTTEGDDHHIASSQLATDWQWTALPRRGSAVTEPTGLGDGQLSLREGDQVVVVDGAFPSITSGGEAPRVTAGTSVRFDLPLAAQGDGNVVPVCMVYDGERRRDVHAVTLWGVPNDWGSVAIYCRAPVDGAIRLGFRVHGPIEASFGLPDITVDPDPDL